MTTKRKDAPTDAVVRAGKVAEAVIEKPEAINMERTTLKSSNLDSTKPPTDDLLIDLARAGDHEAFRELVKRYQNQVAATVIGMLGDSPEADDIGQETFVRFYNAISDFRGESKLGTYLTRIAINLSLNELKKRRRRRLFFTPYDQTTVEQIEGKTEGIDFEDKEMINRSLQQLRPDHRAVIVLRLIDGYSTRETAEILKLPMGTVLSRLARAQDKLRTKLEPYYRGEDRGKE